MGSQACLSNKCFLAKKTIKSPLSSMRPGVDNQFTLEIESLWAKVTLVSLLLLFFVSFQMLIQMKPQLEIF